MKLRCPCCPLGLSRFKLKGKDFYACTEHGILAGGGAIQTFFKDRQLADDLVSRIKSKASGLESARRCPLCSGPFLAFKTETFSFVQVDACARCHAFWFDNGEWESLKAAAHVEPANPGEIDRAFAPKPKSKVKISRQATGLIDIQEVPWKGQFADFEESKHIKTRPPILTYMFVFFALIATLMAFSQPGLYERWAFVPTDPLANLGMRLVSSLFFELHYAYLLVSILALITVGDDVEDEIGHGEMLQLFLLSGLAGNAVYAISGGTVMSTGMGPAVAGLIAYYGIRFPNNRLRTTLTPHRYRYGVGEYQDYSRNWLFGRRRVGVVREFVPGETLTQVSISAQAFLIFYILWVAFGFYFNFTAGVEVMPVNFAAQAGGLAFGALYTFLRK